MCNLLFIVFVEIKLGKHFSPPFLTLYDKEFFRHFKVYQIKIKIINEFEII